MADETEKYQAAINAKKSDATKTAKPDNGTTSQHLQFIAPRETQRLLAARGGRATRIVSWLRIALPAGAALMILALIVWPMIETNSIKTAVMKNIPDLVIDNLHYTGLDNRNQPYSLTAEKATRPAGMNNLYDLDAPQAETTLSTGAWVAGKAQYGRFDEATRRLWLGGNVEVFHDKGYQFTTDEAQIDMNKDLAWGEKPVLLQGSFGEIRGQGFKWLDSGNTIVIKGPAHAVLGLHGTPASDKPKGKK